MSNWDKAANLLSATGMVIRAFTGNEQQRQQQPSGLQQQQLNLQQQQQQLNLQRQQQLLDQQRQQLEQQRKQQQQYDHAPQQQQYHHHRRQQQWEEEEEEEQQQNTRPKNRNLLFYQNQIPSQPNGAKIEDILTNWFGNDDKLLKHTGYIQWLFPNKDAGMNPYAFSLEEEEAKTIRSDPVLKNRVLRAFALMLDIYGMVVEEDQFQLKNENPNVLENFISHKPSALFITRILKSLKVLGHKNLMVPWLKFLAELIYQKRMLPIKFRKSFTDFWMETLDKADQETVKQFCATIAENE